VIDKLKELSGKPYTWYLIDLIRQEDALLAMKEGVTGPIRKFMSGPQKGIYDNAVRFFKDHESNISYLGEQNSTDGDTAFTVNDEQEPVDGSLLTANALQTLLADPHCFKGNAIQNLKSQVETLQARVTKQIGQEITLAQKKVDALKSRLIGQAEFSALNSEQQQQITRPFDDFHANIERQKLIAVIRDTLRRFEENEYQRLLSQMTAWAQPAPTPAPAPSAKPCGAAKPDGEPVPAPPPQKPEPRIEYLPCRAVKVAFDKAWLANETDVDDYLKSLREALLDEIRKGKRIQI
jgi:hypothetical protein